MFGKRNFSLIFKGNPLATIISLLSVMLFAAGLFFLGAGAFFRQLLLAGYGLIAVIIAAMVQIMLSYFFADAGQGTTDMSKRSSRSSAVAGERSGAGQAAEAFSAQQQVSGSIGAQQGTGNIGAQSLARAAAVQSGSASARAQMKQASAAPLQEDASVPQDPVRMMPAGKVTYCKNCGGVIDPLTRRCAGCGRQYARPSHVAIAVLSILCAALLVYSVITYHNYRTWKTYVETLDTEFAELYKGVTDPLTGREITSARGYLTALKDQQAMNMQGVASGEISQIGYNFDNRILFLRFREDDSLFAYYDVSADTYREMVSAESIPEYYESHIKGLYNTQKLN